MTWKEAWNRCAKLEIAFCDFQMALKSQCVTLDDEQSWCRRLRLQVDQRRSSSKKLTLESAKFAENIRFWVKRPLDVQKLYIKLSGFPTGSDRWRTVKEYLKVQQNNTHFLRVERLFCKLDLQKYGFRGECGMCKFCTYHSLWRNCGQKIWPQNSKIRRK